LFEVQKRKAGGTWNVFESFEKPETDVKAIPLRTLNDETPSASMKN
jgi:hypothetical protein